MFDFWGGGGGGGGDFLNFNRVLPGDEMVKCLVFGNFL